MAIHTIYISATLKKPFPPKLSDDEGHTSETKAGDERMTTLINPGDKIIWIKAGDISSIDDISYAGGKNLFSSGPTKQSNGTWEGIVADLPESDENNEDYNISYTVSKSFTQDPKLRIR